MTHYQLKEQAKDEIHGSIFLLFLCTLIYAIILYFSLIPIIFIPNILGFTIFFLVFPVLNLGYLRVYYHLKQEYEPDMRDLWSGLPSWKGALVYGFMSGLFTFLWSLLFVIPGIIKGLSYSMGYYILLENPQMSGMDALNKSKQIMKGHEIDLLMLYLSFIGWILLSCIFCCFPFIYVTPYMQQTLLNFYFSIKPQDDITN